MGQAIKLAAIGAVAFRLLEARFVIPRAPTAPLAADYGAPFGRVVYGGNDVVASTACAVALRIVAR